MEQIFESFISLFRRFSGSYLSLFRRLGHAFPSLMRMLGRVFPSLLRATSYAAPFLLREGSELVEGRVRSHIMSEAVSPMASSEENPLLHHLQSQSESVLWNVLDGSKIGGLEFLRQYSVGSYLLDFYCPSLKLGIDIVDKAGVRVDEVINKLKEEYLTSCGISRLQCSSEEIFYHCDHIVTQILERQNGKEI